MYLQRDGATCELISEKYDYNNIQLKCQCGSVYTTSINNLIRTRQYVCPCCGRNRGNLLHRQDEKYLPLLGKYNITLLEDYKGAKYRHWAKTEEGYYTKISLYNLSKGLSFYDYAFDKDNLHALDNIKLWLKLNGDKLSFISSKYKGAKERYKFKCSCGEIFETSWQYIRLNNITRCPRCTHKTSSLELKTQEWLDEHNILYEREKSFEGCVFKNPLRFDFYLPETNKIIEVDGEQHFHTVSFGNRSQKEALQSYNCIKERDEIKNKYCEKHNISLLRIPYTVFNSNKYKEILTTFMAEI